MEQACAYFPIQARLPGDDPALGNEEEDRPNGHFSFQRLATRVPSGNDLQDHKAHFPCLHRVSGASHLHD